MDRPSERRSHPIAGKYEVLEKLGDGATGTTYKVRHTLVDTVLSVTVLPATLTDDPGQRARRGRRPAGVPAPARAHRAGARFRRGGGGVLPSRSLRRRRALGPYAPRAGPARSRRGAPRRAPAGRRARVRSRARRRPR